MTKIPCGDLSILESHPQWPLAIKIYQTLVKSGFETYFAGGCVRDLCLKTLPKDIDIATSARPDEIKKLFPKTINVGEAFGVIRVIENFIDIEVATFRTDGTYQDGRRPDKVSFSSSQEDAERRDFTINALFLDYENKQIIDFVGGIADLQKKTIRTVGDPVLRLTEDHLRTLRALRFSAQLDFEIEPQTAKALKERASTLVSISKERVRDEILKMLRQEKALKGLNDLISYGVLQVLWPEVSVDICQERWTVLFQVSESEDLHRVLKFFWPLFESCQDWKLAEQLLARFVPTTIEKKAARKLVQFLSEGESWKKWRVGEKRLFVSVPPGLWILQRMSLLDSSWKKEIQALNLEPLPEAFLKGEDVDHLVGAEKGKALGEAYLLQLEGHLKSREEALRWLQGYSQGT